ncbi:hypothetical protein ACRAWF_03950 [Streptomyces sp. L7]
MPTLETLIRGVRRRTLDPQHPALGGSGSTRTPSRWRSGRSPNAACAAHRPGGARSARLGRLCAVQPARGGRPPRLGARDPAAPPAPRDRPAGHRTTRRHRTVPDGTAVVRTRCGAGTAAASRSPTGRCRPPY